VLSVCRGRGDLRNMSLEAVRLFCRSLPEVTEDVKWGNDLVFSVGGKMFAALDLEPPHSLAFKCSDETFAELSERDGMIPAPYLARARWMQEQELGAVLERREREALLAAAYAAVVAKLPASRRPGRTGQPGAAKSAIRRKPRRK
jgi:predicted DNA-binding protein (MmcQ/YjbR family)